MKYHLTDGLLARRSMFMPNRPCLAFHQIRMWDGKMEGLTKTAMRKKKINDIQVMRPMSVLDSQFGFRGINYT
jgi:hypothetical protein